MKIGVFDSGLGGLVVLKSIVKKLPQNDYVYLGDTLHMPYGNRSQTEIYKYTKKAVKFLFKQDCKLIIIACNTASSRTLRKLQREFLPAKYPNRRILGVIIPTAEIAGNDKKIKTLGIFATKATINSRSYVKEVGKINRKTKVVQAAAPKLAAAIETADKKTVAALTNEYLRPLLKKHPDSIILGCTHYSLIQPLIRSIVGKGIKIIDQTDSIPAKTVDYLRRHKEISKQLDTARGRKFYVTQLTPKNTALAKRWFGRNTKLSLVKI